MTLVINVTTLWGFIVFYGVTRYSLFSPGSLSWKTSRDGVFETQDDYMRYLFSEKRLELRAELFLTKSVPVLAKMAEDYEYTHFVLYSEFLPERHKTLLLETAATHPFLVPVEWNDVVRGTGIQEVSTLINRELAAKFDASSGVQPVVWFRLDDDDVLASNYLKCLEKYRTLGNVGMAISFGLGLTAFRAEQELVNLREYYHPKSAQGMAFVSAFDPGRGHLDISTPGPHTSVDLVMPTILDSREHMFFQIRHSEQDSTLSATPYERTAETLAKLEKLPAVRPEDVSAEKWPTLFDDLAKGALPGELMPDARSVLLSEETVLTLPLVAGEGLVEVEFEFESERDLEGGFAVISYELRGADSIDPGTLGLMRTSRNGLCRPVWSRSSRGLVRQCVLLPEGVSIKSVTLRGKKRQPADVLIRWRSPRVVEVHTGE